MSEKNKIAELKDEDLVQVTGGSGEGETIAEGSWVRVPNKYPIGGDVDGISWVKSIVGGTATLKSFFFHKRSKNITAAHTPDEVSVSSLVIEPKPLWTNNIPDSWF